MFHPTSAGQTIDPAVHCRWKRAFEVFSPSAMCGLDQSSGWARQSAREQQLWRDYMPFSQLAPLRRDSSSISDHTLGPSARFQVRKQWSHDRRSANPRRRSRPSLGSPQPPRPRDRAAAFGGISAAAAARGGIDPRLPCLTKDWQRGCWSRRLDREAVTVERPAFTGPTLPDCFDRRSDGAEIDHADATLFGSDVRLPGSRASAAPP